VSGFEAIDLRLTIEAEKVEVEQWNGRQWNGQALQCLPFPCGLTPYTTVYCAAIRFSRQPGLG
jgi:hypothetical protein